MKVSILTFHNAHNYGAVLQAYALKTKIESMGHDVVIENYCNNKIEKRYDAKLKIEISKRDVINPIRWLSILKKKNQIEFAQAAWKKQCYNFNEFIDKYLLEGNKTKKTIEDLEKTNTDIFICGSDQVWTSWITGGLDDVYLLNFKTNAKRVSYAASIGSEVISNEEKKKLKETLEKFDKIAVRELQIKNKLSEFINNEIYVALDPTLLIDANDYKLIESKKKLQEEKYVFAYFVNESDELMEVAQKVAKDLGFKLIELHYYLRKDLKDHNQIADIGPSEFLYYIKNSEFVLTNSFHGTVFSILYKKKFYSVYNSDVRKDGLLKTLQISERHIKCKKEIDLSKKINYEVVYEKLKKYRQGSLDYLSEILI